MKCHGNSGHGSLFVNDTPGKKIQYLINKFMNWRDSEEQKLKDNAELEIGDVTTINLTVISGGNQINVIPNEMILVFDIRVAVDVEENEFDQKAILLLFLFSEKQNV